jgi:hypothetical protein
VTDIVGNTICADLIDYIQRDHASAGLPLALGNRFVNDFYVTGTHAVHWRERMVVQISRHGHLRRDVVSELVKYLRYRYELSERVLYHHAKVAADAMIGKLLEMWRDALWMDEAERRFPALLEGADNGHDLTELRKRVGEFAGASVLEEVDSLVAGSVEDVFVRWSDDGLLEHLAMTADNAVEAGGAGARRQIGIATISRMVLNRQLFKSLGRADSDADLANAKATHKRFGPPEERRRLEEEAATFAGIKPRWKVVLWIPSPKMRMKVADVLVDLDGRVAPLAEMHTTNSRANAIVEQHRRLWGVGAYVHPDVTRPLQRRAALAWLKDEMGLGFLDASGTPAESVADLITTTLSDQLGLSAEERFSVRKLAASSGLGSEETFVSMLRRVDALRHTKGVKADTDFDMAALV